MQIQLTRVLRPCWETICNWKLTIFVDGSGVAGARVARISVRVAASHCVGFKCHFWTKTIVSISYPNLCDKHPVVNWWFGWCVGSTIMWVLRYSFFGTQHPPKPPSHHWNGRIEVIRFGFEISKFRQTFLQIWHHKWPLTGSGLSLFAIPSSQGFQEAVIKFTSVKRT